MNLLAHVTPSWAGSIPTWALLVLALAASWRVATSGGGAAVSELKDANQVLTDRLQQVRDKMGGEIRDLRIENAELRGKTDVAIAISTWGEGHERRAQERHEATLVVLDLIAKRLGPDVNGDLHTA